MSLFASSLDLLCSLPPALAVLEPDKVFLSLLLLVGLCCGVSALICLSLASVRHYRAGLLVLGVLALLSTLCLPLGKALNQPALAQFGAGGIPALLLLAVLYGVSLLHPQRRLLGLAVLLGFTAFLVGTLVLAPAGFRLQIFYFWLFTAAVIGGGFGCVTMRNVFHAALMLILCLAGVGGYFILVNAEFLAMVQVIIYIGGIMVLFLFGIMVSQNIIGTEIRQNNPQSPWAGVLAAVMFIFMAMVGLFMTFPQQPTMGRYVLDNNTQALGWSLMATYTLPFAVASVLLLMAMMGAIVLVRKE
ncbi:NADH-quinone oxidoreductase subunit J [bacterium]|nr:NADH-quinone oxidoreductase subunit J [bacterium]